MKSKASANRKVLLKSILVSYVIAFSIFVVLISFAPDATPYSINNYGWNGMHQASTKYDFREVSSISLVPPSPNSVLLEVAPAVSFSDDSIAFARDFLQSGGTLIVADSSGVSNSLLKGLGSAISISGNAIYDPVYNWKQKIVPLVLVSGQNSGYSFLSGVSSLAMLNASSVTIQNNGGPAQAIAYSSPESEAVNSSTKALISKGPFLMAAVENIGSGRLIVIADSTFFLNSVWTIGNNELFSNNVFQNSSVYLDTSNWPINSETTIRAQLVSFYATISSVPYRYIFAISFIGIGFLGFQVFRDVATINLKSRKGTQGGSTFNNEILDRVRKDREKYGTARAAS